MAQVQLRGQEFLIGVTLVEEYFGFLECLYCFYMYNSNTHCTIIKRKALYIQDLCIEISSRLFQLNLLKEYADENTNLDRFHLVYQIEHCHSFKF